MKKIFMVAAALCCMTMTAWAASQSEKSKMSPWLLLKYQQQQEAVKRNGGPLRVKGRPVVNYVMTLVESADGSETIRQKGGVVWKDFGNGICAAFLPTDCLGALDRCPAILRMEANEPARAMNDTSAVIMGVDRLHQPQPQLPQAFTGKGVIASVADQSFDFTHPAFRNSDGTSRIQWFWDLAAGDSDSDELGVIYDTPQKVLAAQRSSDAVRNVAHGTHVMGSMAGSGLNGRYVGMAPEADITGGLLPFGPDLTEDIQTRLANYVKKHTSDYGLTADAILQITPSETSQLVLLDKIFGQATAVGKPCVVNWSFGAGPEFNNAHELHETVFNQMVGPGRIVVISAGNTGHLKTFVHKDADDPLKQEVFFKGTNPQYIFDILSKSDDSSFTIAVSFEETDDTLRLDVHTSQDSKPIMDDPVSPQLVAIPMTYVGNRKGFRLVFRPGEHFGNPGDLAGTIHIDTPVELDFSGINSGASSVTFSKESYDNSRGCQQYTLGFPASLNRAITVGAMHHRSSFTNILGEPATYKNMYSEEGHLVSFSSCGPTIDGRIKPDVVAPGHNIISAMSSFYRVNDNDEQTRAEEAPLMACEANVFGKDYGVWAMSGTSMACPVAAGVIALWLQAKPDLTPEDIKDVIARTSHQPEPEFSGSDKNIYYGWGEIDAYAGLLDILGVTTRIPGLSWHQPAGIVFRVRDNRLIIEGAAADTPVTLYDLNGRSLLHTVAGDGSVSLGGLSKGVYAVQLGQRGSTLIRL